MHRRPADSDARSPEMAEGFAMDKSKDVEVRFSRNPRSLTYAENGSAHDAFFPHRHVAERVHRARYENDRD